MLTDWVHMGEHLTWGSFLFRTAVAVIIALIIGIDREIKSRPAGMRTHVLVCLGAALIAMVEQEMIAQVVSLGHTQINVSVGRITSSVVSGVGFLGAGTIIFADHKITGLTTAASLWCTACIGLAVGAGFEIMAAVVGILVLCVLILVQKVVHVRPYKRLEVQFVHREETLAFIDGYFAEKGIVVVDVDFHSETRNNGENVYTNIYALTLPSHSSYVGVMEHLMKYQDIRTVRTRNV